MRVIIHIGSTKTGSSALQATLFRERERLSEGGVLYPDKGVASSAHHLLFAAVHPGAWRMHQQELPEDREAYFRETAAAIMAEAADGGANAVILSSEYLWGNFRPDFHARLKDAFGAHPIEIVAFLRRPDHWMVSSWMQAVKSGEKRDFPEWAEAVMKNRRSGFWYHEVLENWRAGVGASHVHVLRYEQDVKRNVFRAFCEATGLGAFAEEVVPVRANPSPDAEGLRLLLEVNRSDLDEEEKRSRRAEIMRAHRANGPTTGIVDDETRYAILRASIPSNQKIRRDFLNGEGTSLFREPWPRAAVRPNVPRRAAPGPSRDVSAREDAAS